MPPPRRPYFAYGSNMCPDQMARRCPDAQPVGVARLDGHRFFINGRGYASIQPDPDRAVLGMLWCISPSDEASLDQYEDIAKGLYGKLEVSVALLAGGQPQTAMTYIAANTTPGPPRDGYLEIILRAADLHQFPEAYRRELASWRQPSPAGR